MRKVDADMVREMRRMNREGMNNREIAERLGVAASTVWTHLADHGIYSPASRLSQYTVYDRDGQVAAFGTARECCKTLGIKYETFWSYIARGRGRIVKELFS